MRCRNGSKEGDEVVADLRRRPPAISLASLGGREGCPLFSRDSPLPRSPTADRQDALALGAGVKVVLSVDSEVVAQAVLPVESAATDVTVEAHHLQVHVLVVLLRSCNTAVQSVTSGSWTGDPLLHPVTDHLDDEPDVREGLLRRRQRRWWWCRRMGGRDWRGNRQRWLHGWQDGVITDSRIDSSNRSRVAWRRGRMRLCGGHDVWDVVSAVWHEGSGLQPLAVAQQLRDS